MGGGERLRDGGGGERGGGERESIMCKLVILSHWVQIRITLPLEALDVKR